MTQFSALVFFSVSTGSSRHLHLLRLLRLQVFESSSLQVIFFFKYYSSRDLHHHDYWIIITSGSSLDLDHHQVWSIITTRSSLDLDRHQVWIITFGSLDLDHHHMLSQNGAISILLVIGSSTNSIL